MYDVRGLSGDTVVIKFVVVMIPSLTSNNIPLYQCA